MVRILHLSDIHFGRNNPIYNLEVEFQKKDTILQEIIQIISKMEDKPDHIIMTGDIAWHGKKQEFEEALKWFEQLLAAAALSAEDITVCPGNHDVNRGYVNFDFNTADFLSFADYFFDGLLADWMMQDRINKARNQVDEAIKRVEYILARL